MEDEFCDKKKKEDELVSTKTELGWDGYHATMLAHHQYLLVMGVHCSGYDLF